MFNGVLNWARKERVNWLQWQASESAVKFYEKLGYSGDPCPDPEHPFFEIEFSDRNIPLLSDSENKCLMGTVESFICKS